MMFQVESVPRRPRMIEKRARKEERTKNAGK
jgi:hypothetical protein